MAIDGGLEVVLERSRSLGFLGPGSLRVQAEHAAGFAEVVDRTPARLLDLGTGGGVPGLVLADRWRETEVVLLDAAERRCRFLEEAVADLGWSERVRVVRARAEDAGRREDLRGGFDLVVARGFGPPGVTAECGAPFLRMGGELVVSEPPTDDDAGRTERWPAQGLARLGLRPAGSWEQPFHYRAFEQAEPCSDRFPRRVGIPAKRPLF
jgi:16S rRNA (guanine527-N7)-methyltransferase